MSSHVTKSFCAKELFKYNIIFLDTLLMAFEVINRFKMNNELFTFDFRTGNGMGL